MWSALLNYLRSETVAIMGLVQVSLALGLAYDLHMTGEQEGLWLALAAAVLSLITRQTVTPNVKVPPTP